MKTPALLLVASLVPGPLHGQFTLQNTAPTSLRSLLSLQAGPKLMDQYYGGSTVTVYNIDLSVHRVLTIPAPPSGYTWGGLTYITEELFDTDPATIEFLVNGYSQDPGDFVLKVFREDGSEIFSKAPGMTFSVGGLGLEIGPAIFQTNTGAVMLTQTTFGSPTEIYALPGHVPCVDMCYETAYEAGALGMDGRVSMDGGELVVLNQGSADAIVQYTLPPAASAGTLRVVDAQGKWVLSETVAGQGSLRLGTIGLATGVYQVSIALDRGARLDARLLILR